MEDEIYVHVKIPAVWVKLKLYEIDVMQEVGLSAVRFCLYCFDNKCNYLSM